MPTSITFLPNGEYIQGHIPCPKKDGRENRVDASPSGMAASLREAISASPELPDCLAIADMEPWEQPGTKYFGINASIWTIKETRWNGYLFSRKQYNKDVGEFWVSGRGVKWLIKAHLEPFCTEYNNIFKITTDTYVDDVDPSDSESSPFGSSSADILDHSRNRKKCERLSKYMARSIRNGCYLMEQRYGVDNLSFLTLTVPALSPDGYETVCHLWNILVNRFTKWLRKETIRREGYEQEYVYCTEIQEKRRRRTGVVAPHLHIVFRGRRGRGGAWTFSPSEIRAKWAGYIRSYVGELFETRALENIQQVKSSAGGYLAKYLGKGVDASECPALRTHWGGMSRNLSRLIKRCSTTWRSDRNEAEYIHGFLQHQESLRCNGLIKKYTRYWVDLSDGRRVVSARDGCEYGGQGFWVGSGVLGRPTYCGGLVDVVAYLHTVM